MKHTDIKLKFIARLSKILWQKPQQLLLTGTRASRVNATKIGTLNLIKYCLILYYMCNLPNVAATRITQFGRPRIGNGLSWISICNFFDIANIQLTAG